MKKFVAIIPARSGSKGLPHKNIKVVKGKELLNYSVDAAIKSSYISKVIVSSDSNDYLNKVTKHDKVALHRRSEELSMDTSLTEDVIISIIKEFNLNDEDYFVLLQPTSPLRNEYHIDEAINLLTEKNKQSLVSVAENTINSAIVNTLDNNLSMENFINTYKVNRRQNMLKEFYINGAIYISNVGEYKLTKNFYGKSSIAYIMDEKSSVDIDNKLDMDFFEFLINNEN
ncbi:cytidylyltransferase domain-containing protein [Macrococcus armenti]|uniref:Acylneuraminate cytidylyltransferase family protein n=1 Tax=Macrococcus armenti TaxID=2875764 RepID=A0ABY3ZWF7_9STAP|nr:acylneuraminate cytidylyltransferase family protein [Macrococcus armenti]UOB21235.1 acylneuraminate cytidylyltransferase family protein [Macrococcus armenti]